MKLHLRRYLWNDCFVCRHWCGGRVATPEELPSCYPEDDDWSDVTLDEFLSCPHNLAFNRQTRMMADLNLVNCYNQSGMDRAARESLMLASAKENLERMSYFGLCENQSVSQYLFEQTFKLFFLRPFLQFNETHSSLALTEVSHQQMTKIKRLNQLDLELYRFARKLLFRRFNRLRKERGEKVFKQQFNEMKTRNPELPTPKISLKTHPKTKDKSDSSDEEDETDSRGTISPHFNDPYLDYLFNANMDAL